MTPETIYLQIYDGKISLNEFKKWLEKEIKKAYDKGLIDSLADDLYDDISKSQYD